jgi:hypothetical protein
MVAASILTADCAGAAARSEPDRNKLLNAFMMYPLWIVSAKATSSGLDIGNLLRSGVNAGLSQKWGD